MKSEKLRASRRRFLTSIGATAAMLPFLRSLPGYAQGTPATLAKSTEEGLCDLRQQ
jgi:hypothetical protein